ncbi:hypothetical protein TNIN_201701 [Trichonephila inaurata madagascariensis]|uniref:Uncharacterized protein n=1 Tax=Trichonephila inaurata madagascariensis TaxID=2747483 RepID=A0A8X6M9Y1_9ARAC|nr:hypothetical protein TNIN_201701 [Trichonephila inaurata madagascariensis]
MRNDPQPKTVSEPPRFLVILNFYHRFLKSTANEQAHMQILRKGKLKDSSTIGWSNEKVCLWKVQEFHPPSYGSSLPEDRSQPIRCS